MAADWRGLAAAPAHARPAAGASRSVLSDGTLRIDRLDHLPRDHVLCLRAADSSHDTIVGWCDLLQRAARFESESSLPPHDADDRAAAAGRDVSRCAVAGRVGRLSGIRDPGSEIRTTKTRRRVVRGDVDALRSMAGGGSRPCGDLVRVMAAWRDSSRCLRPCGETRSLARLRGRCLPDQQPHYGRRMVRQRWVLRCRSHLRTSAVACAHGHLVGHASTQWLLDRSGGPPRGGRGGMARRPPQTRRIAARHALALRDGGAAVRRVL